MNQEKKERKIPETRMVKIEGFESFSKKTFDNNKIN